MAIDKFWSNVRGLAAGVFRFDVFIADEPLPTSEEIESRLRAQTGWFRKLAVVGFSKEEFGEFLQPEELAELVSGVEGMRTALDAKNLAAGVTAFARILGVLNFYLYADIDGLRVGKQIERDLRERGWPEYLRELRFWRATQDDEFPVLSIYAHMREAQLKTIARYLEACRELRPILSQVSRQVAPGWFPHITFRTDDTLAEYADRPDEDDLTTVGAPAAKMPGAA